MALTPNDPEAQKLVEGIEVTGAKGQVKTIATRQADGDSTTMTITGTP